MSKNILLTNVKSGIIITDDISEYEYDFDTYFPRSLKLYRKYLYNKNGQYDKNMLGKIIVPKEKSGVRVCRMYFSNLDVKFKKIFIYYKMCTEKLVKYAKEHNEIITVTTNFGYTYHGNADFLNYLRSQCKKNDVGLNVIGFTKEKDNSENNTRNSNSMADEIAETWGAWDYEYSFY